MRKIRNIIVFLALIAVLVIGFFMFYKGKTSQLQASNTPLEELIVKGEYIARAGDCVACHTAPGGDMFAGGLGMESGSPVGTIYSTNITPDKATGIGNYSLQDFDNAVRHGLRKDGASLYPAMPFPSYAITTDDEIEALYAYFMNQVEPVSRANQPVSGSWPFSMRWPLNAWRIFFSQPVAPYVAPAGYDETVARGAYLVEGWGHCGSCHTPRSLTLNERAYSDDGSGYYLSGAAALEGWVPINLRGDHVDGLGTVSEEQLFQLLKTGRNDTSAVFGSMSDVINHSLQYLSDDDLLAMARYLKTLSPKNPANPPFAYNDKVYQALFNGDDSAVGARTYIDNCAACHRTDGKGYAQTFPALAGNPVIQSTDPSSLINVVLRGDTLHGTKGAPTSYTMPAFAWRLDDQEIADVITFIRASWGNQGAPVTADLVKKYRAELSDEVIQYQQAQTNPVEGNPLK